MFLISLCRLLSGHLQKLSGHNVCIEIIESLGRKFLWSGRTKKTKLFLTYFRYVVVVSILLFNIIVMHLMLSNCYHFIILFPFFTSTTTLISRNHFIVMLSIVHVPCALAYKMILIQPFAPKKKLFLL